MRAHPSRRPGAALALALSLLALAPATAAAPPGSPWGASYFPDVELTTHDGRKVRFYSDLVEGKLVVVSFVYTRCTRVCGLATANLARVQRALGDRVGRDIHFYSVSLDPEHDTPERLRAYAAAFRARAGWTFLTGRKEDVEALRARFGDRLPVEEHAPVVEIGNDRTGQWWRTAVLDNPTYLATVIGGFMDPGWKGIGGAGREYASAPAPAAPGRGQKLFLERCAACHVPGGDSVGPDLAGVTGRRDPAWLARWIESPGKLIDERDPIALELLERHGGVPMPATGLGAAEVREVIDHLRAADRRRPPAGAAGPAP